MPSLLLLPCLVSCCVCLCVCSPRHPSLCAEPAARVYAPALSLSGLCTVSDVESRTRVSPTCRVMYSGESYRVAERNSESSSRCDFRAAARLNSVNRCSGYMYFLVAVAHDLSRSSRPRIASPIDDERAGYSLFPVSQIHKEGGRAENLHMGPTVRRASKPTRRASRIGKHTLSLLLRVWVFVIVLRRLSITIRNERRNWNFLIDTIQSGKSSS